jgi:hypothetical protein
MIDTRKEVKEGGKRQIISFDFSVDVKFARR